MNVTQAIRQEGRQEEKLGIARNMLHQLHLGLEVVQASYRAKQARARSSVDLHNQAVLPSAPGDSSAFLLIVFADLEITNGLHLS